MRPEEYDFGDFDWVEESAHKPEWLPRSERRGEGAGKFLLGNVEANPGLFWLGVFYVDVIFGKRQSDQILSTAQQKNLTVTGPCNEGFKFLKNQINNGNFSNWNSFL